MDLDRLYCIVEREDRVEKERCGVLVIRFKHVERQEPAEGKG